MAENEILKWGNWTHWVEFEANCWIERQRSALVDLFDTVQFIQAAVARATDEGRAAARGLSSAQAAAAAAFGIVTVEQVNEAWAEVVAGCALQVGIVDNPIFRNAVMLTAKCGSAKLSHGGVLQLAHRSKMGYKICRYTKGEDITPTKKSAK